MLAKGYSYKKISSTFFILFVLSVGLHKSNYLIAQLTGIDLQSIIGASLLAFPLIFLFISYYYSSARRTSSGKNKDSTLVNFIFFYVNFLLLYGILSGNDTTTIFFEYWTGVIVLLSYKIAVSENIWHLFEGKLKIVFLVFAGLVFLGRGYTLGHLVERGYDAFETGKTTALLSYDMAPILDFWPFLFLLGFFNKKIKKSRILVFVPLIIYLSFQLFFLKRAPSVRAISFLILATFIKMKIIGNSNAFIKQIFVFTVIGISILFFTPDALVNRFEVKDTARQDEALGMLSQLTPTELVFGKGLGGTYYVSGNGITQSINNEGRRVNSILHIGATYPILKGGFLLFFLIFYHVLRTVSRNVIRIKKMSNRELTCLVFLVVYSVFRLIEGPISPGAIFDALLFGMSLGYLNRNIKTEF